MKAKQLRLERLEDRDLPSGLSLAVAPAFNPVVRPHLSGTPGTIQAGPVVLAVSGASPAGVVVPLVRY